MQGLFFHNPLPSEQLKQRPTFRADDAVDLRGVYFRDTTAIIHSYPFRRLKNKTQVFFAPKNDHICTRIEHVQHVATVAATICKALDLDSDLAWAIGMGHDLGHAPFGHLGETILTKLYGQGEFKHEMYSLRVVDYLAGYGKGLNLTYAVRDGILNHCGEKFESEIKPDFTIRDLGSVTTRDFYPSTWEGCVVRMCDKIAYLGRDLEDAVQLRITEWKDIPEESARILGSSNSRIINTLVNDLIKTSMEKGVIGFSNRVFEAFLLQKDFNYRNIYKNPILSDYHDYFERILTTLYNYLDILFSRLGVDLDAYERENNRLARRFGRYIAKMQPFYELYDGNYEKLMLDYIAGMSDEYALSCVNEIMVPRKFEFQFE